MTQARRLQGQQSGSTTQDKRATPARATNPKIGGTVRRNGLFRQVSPRLLFNLAGVLSWLTSGQSSRATVPRNGGHQPKDWTGSMRLTCPRSLAWWYLACCPAPTASSRYSSLSFVRPSLWSLGVGPASLAPSAGICCGPSGTTPEKRQERVLICAASSFAGLSHATLLEWLSICTVRTVHWRWSSPWFCRNAPLHTVSR